MAIVPSRKKLNLNTYIPVAILIDRSASMSDVLDIINSCMSGLIRELKSELLFKGQKVLLLVVSFNHKFKILLDFEELDNIDASSLSIEEASGATDPGLVLLNVLERLDSKKAEWKEQSVAYCQPFVYLFTDGYPDAGTNASDADRAAVTERYNAAAKWIREKESAQDGKEKIVFIAAGLQRKKGASANIEMLRELTTHPDHVITISEDNSSMRGISKFFELIKTATLNPDSFTPDIINEIF